MTKLMTLAAAAMATALAASPVMAKDAAHHADKKMTNSHKVKPGKHAGMAARNRTAANATMRDDRGFDRGAAYDNGYGRPYASGAYDRGPDTGFWPADAAGAIVGGAIGTAGAIATAPFRDTYASYDDDYDAGPVYRSSGAWNDSYGSSWNNGWNSNWNNNWARRQSVEQGGFICTPGSTYTNSYGYTQICQ